MQDLVEIMLKETLENTVNTLNNHEETEKNEFDISNSKIETNGIYFKIEENFHSFFIKTAIGKNIKQDEKEIRERWKIESSKLHNDIYFFETPDRELAEVIHDQMGNIRYPSEGLEQQIGTRDFHWWADTSENLTIHFNNLVSGTRPRFLLLGPLGDPFIAIKRFTEMKESLILEYRLKDIVISPKSIRFISENQSSQKYLLLKDFFLRAINLECYYNERMNKNLGSTNSLYIRELFFLRKFWMKVEQKKINHLN